MNHATPSLAVDLVILDEPSTRFTSRFVDDTTRMVVIERHFEPKGLALPGGFVEIGESTEAAAIREAKEETNLTVELLGLIGVFSDPARDPRCHVVSVAYLACVSEDSQPLHAGDDAKAARFELVSDFKNLQWCFDHKDIISKARYILRP